MFWNYNGKVQVDREEAGKLSFSIMGLVEMIINVYHIAEKCQRLHSGAIAMCRQR